MKLSLNVSFPVLIFSSSGGGVVTVVHHNELKENTRGEREREREEAPLQALKTWIRRD